MSEVVCLMYPWRDVVHIHLQLHHLVSCFTIVLEHRIHSGSRCAIKCEFRHTPEGKLSDFSTADLKHGFSVGQTHGSNIKKTIYGVPILEHKISDCVTFAVE